METFNVTKELNKDGMKHVMEIVTNYQVMGLTPKNAQMRILVT